MKNIIILWPLMLLLMFFPAQFCADTINNMKRNAFNNIVDNHIQIARSDGCFTAANTNAMSTELSTALYINNGDISINVTTTPVYRTTSFDDRQTIKYSVFVPINKMIAMNKFLNISDANNTSNYGIIGESPSELLP